MVLLPDSPAPVLPHPGGAEGEAGALPRSRSSGNTPALAGLRQTRTVTAREAVYRAVEAVEQSIADPGLRE